VRRHTKNNTLVGKGLWMHELLNEYNMATVFDIRRLECHCNMATYIRKSKVTCALI